MDKSRATRRTFLSASGGLLGLVGTGGALSDQRVDPRLRARTGETDVVLRLETADTGTRRDTGRADCRAQDRDSDSDRHGDGRWGRDRGRHEQ
jgi:hypothetical protein